MRGIPVRVEIGPKDIEANQAVLARRDTGEKIVVSADELETKVDELLKEIQSNMFEKARAHRVHTTYVATNYDEFKDIIANKPGFVKAMCVVIVPAKTRSKKKQQPHPDVCHLHRNIYPMFVYAADVRLRRWCTGERHTKMDCVSCSVRR